MPAIEIPDSQLVNGRREQLPSKDRMRTEQLTQTRHFKNWLSTIGSTSLLVHGDSRGIQRISALSLFCSEFTQLLMERSNFVSLVFFCGCHIDEDDAFAGSSAIMGSFIAQLLRQHPQINLRSLEQEVDIVRVQQGELESLCVLLGWLVRRLPEGVTLFCIIDGASFYERDEFVVDMNRVVGYLQWLVADQNIAAVVKVLLTSPRPTSILRQLFSDDSVISVAAMPYTSSTPSSARLQRVLSHDL